MITYTPINPIFPNQHIANLPKGLEPLQLWPDDTGVLKRFFLSPFKRRKYIFNQDYITYIPILGKYCVIPANFVYDMASIPALMPGCAHDGILFYGAGPHDFLYRFGGLFLYDDLIGEFVFTEFSHLESDAIFTSLNNKSNKLPRTNQAAEKILNMFGVASYQPRGISKVDWSQPVTSTTGA